ncbi:hypothetical protein [Photorhabdus australis]|uniref:hypothetical protein n=1 Tax=Photorhabdus australis TaxID=286156 RepID=UPI00104201D0|nr:hypothetical protein [Photorhabdus australis]
MIHKLAFLIGGTELRLSPLLSLNGGMVLLGCTMAFIGQKSSTEFFAGKIPSIYQNIKYTLTVTG